MSYREYLRTITSLSDKQKVTALRPLAQSIVPRNLGAAVIALWDYAKLP